MGHQNHHREHLGAGTAQAPFGRRNSPQQESAWSEPSDLPWIGEVSVVNVDIARGQTNPAVRVGMIPAHRLPILSVWIQAVRVEKIARRAWSMPERVKVGPAHIRPNLFHYGSGPLDRELALRRGPCRNRGLLRGGFLEALHLGPLAANATAIIRSCRRPRNSKPVCNALSSSCSFFRRSAASWCGI